MVNFLEKPIKGARINLVGNRTLEEFLNEFKYWCLESLQGYSIEVVEKDIEILKEIFNVYPFDGMIGPATFISNKEQDICVHWHSDNDYYFMELVFYRDGKLGLYIQRGLATKVYCKQNSSDKQEILNVLFKYFEKCFVIEECLNILKNIDNIEDMKVRFTYILDKME